jgi:hypothetical protein
LASSGQAAAQHLTWSAPGQINAKLPLSAVACTSLTLCVAVDHQGHVSQSTFPWIGPSAWSRGQPSTNPEWNFYGLSCTGVQLCLGSGLLLVPPVGESEAIFMSTEASAGAASWKRVFGHATDLTTGALVGISCPSASFCAAASNTGDVRASTNPEAGEGTWIVSTNGIAGTPTAISCTSASLCVVVGQAGNVVTSTEPSKVGGTWTNTALEGASFRGVSCPSSELCVAVGATPGGSGKVVFTSTNPTGGAAAWSGTTLESGSSVPAFSAVSCPSVSFCVAVGGGEVFTSTNPTGGAAAWSGPLQVDTHPLTAVSCPSESFCAAVDEAGDELTALPPLIHKNGALVGSAHVPALGYGQLMLSSAQISGQVECVSLGFGAGWNSLPSRVSSGLPEAVPHESSALGEILSWWGSGHTPTAEHTELDDDCRLVYLGHEYVPGSVSTWATSEAPLHEVIQEAEVCEKPSKRLLSECPGAAEREQTNVVRALWREPPTTPWNVQLTEREGAQRAQVGLPDECRGKSGTERTELSRCPSPGEREHGAPKGCEAPPTPPGCVKVQVVSSPPLNIHFALEGRLEPLSINGVGNGLTPSAWEFEGRGKGEPALRFRDTPTTEVSTTGSMKILGFAGQELLTDN